MTAQRALAEKSCLTLSHNSILIVDDDPAMLRIMNIILSRSGYNVFQAMNGEVALDILRRDEVEVDLVVADIIMPGMAGGELMREARKHRPECKFLFCSGYAEHTSDFLRSDEHAPTLAKPFSPDALKSAVSAALESA